MQCQQTDLHVTKQGRNFEASEENLIVKTGLAATSAAERISAQPEKQSADTQEVEKN